VSETHLTTDGVPIRIGDPCFNLSGQSVKFFPTLLPPIFPARQFFATRENAAKAECEAVKQELINISRNVQQLKRFKP